MALISPPFDQQFGALRIRVGKERAVDVDKELKELMESATTDDERRQAYQLWGEFLLADQRYKNALPKFAEALKFTDDPRRRGRIYSQLAICRRGEGDHQDALEAADESLRLLELYRGQPNVASLYKRMVKLKADMEGELRPPWWRRVFRSGDRYFQRLVDERD